MTSPYKSPWTYDADTDGYSLVKQGKKRTGLAENKTSPFISAARILTAQTCTKNSDQKFSVNVSNGIVNLHHSTMELCSMQYGSAILITTTFTANRQGQIASFKVLPSMSVPPGKIALSGDVMSAFGIEKDEFVHVFGTVDHIQTVETIHLHSKDIDMLPGNYMEEYVSQVLQNRYFVQDQLVTIEYFGKKCPFKIHLEVDEAEKSHEILDNCIMDNNCKKLHDISLNGCSGENGLSMDKVRTQYFQSIEVYQAIVETKVQITRNHLSPLVNHIGEAVSYEHVGGLADQIKKLKNHIELPLNQPKVFKKSGVTPSSGIILHGPCGTGKTMLLKSCSNSVNCPTVFIDVAELCSKNGENVEEELLKYFNSAMKSPPTLVLIDNIDIICSKKDTVRSDTTKRLDLVLCNLLDKISAHNKATHNYVILLTATNTLESITPMLRRTKRLEYEIEIPIPSSSDRKEIFQKELESRKHSLNTADIHTLAEKAHGYVGSDIAAVCKEAGRIAIERCESSSSSLSDLCFQISDLEFALKRVPPSAIRELVVEVPKVMWEDIGGNYNVKKMLEQTVEWPIKHPDAFKRLGIDPPTGVLLYGPPGCSKTLTAKALATESGLNFISIKGPEVFDKYVGDSEKAIRRIFAKARAVSPSIIFIDELDGLAGERSGKSDTSSKMTDRVLTTLLAELDGVEAREDVIIVAATNRPDKIDKALLRPGRIDRMIHVPLPDAETRREIVKIQFKKCLVPPSIDVNWLVEKTSQYSGAEIWSVCREAGIAALEKDMNATVANLSDFESALSLVHPQTSMDVVEMYEKFARTF